MCLALEILHVDLCCSTVSTCGIDRLEESARILDKSHVHVILEDTVNKL